MNDQITRARRVFLVVMCLRWIGTGLTAPVMVLLLTARGLDLAAVGVVFATYGLTTTLLELPTGGAADTLGRRPVLVAAALLFAVFDLGLVLAGGLPGFVAAAVAGGAGRALASGPLESWYVDRARHIDPAMPLRPDLSRAGVVKGAAMAIGALAATGITTLLAGDQFGLEVSALPIAAAVVADLVLAATVVALLREPDRDHDRSALRDAVREVPTAIADGTSLVRSSAMLQRVLVTYGTVAVAVVSIEVLWQPRLADLLDSTAQAARWAGLIVAAFMLAATIGPALARRVPDRFADRPGPAAAWILVGVAASIGLLAGAQTTLLLALGLVAMTATATMSGVFRQELLHEWTPAARRATIVSVSSLVGQGGNLVASLGLAWLAMATSIPLAWLVGAAVILVGAATIATTRMPAGSPTGAG